MKIIRIINEVLITGVVNRLANEAIKEFGSKYTNPKRIFDAFYKSTENEIKKERLKKNKKDIIIAIREFRK